MRRFGVGVLLLLMCGFLTLLTGSGQSQTGQPNGNAVPSSAGYPHPVVVELFTSEGCSSCPPADVFLRKLDEVQPIQGAQLIVLSEHVTYWDHDGWKDPNSSAALTDRQTSYEPLLGEKECFTPQIVVDGDHELKLQSMAQVEDVLKQERDAAKIPIHISAVSVDSANPAELRAHIDTGENSGKHNADVYMAVALNHTESQVLRGENGGHHLVHVAVVQKIIKVGKFSKGKSFTGDIQIKLAPTDDPKNLRVIAFIQESGPGKILGAGLQKLTN